MVAALPPRGGASIPHLDEAKAIASQVLHTVAQPTRVGSQEFTDNVCRRLGSQHDSAAEAWLHSISLHRYVSPPGARQFDDRSGVLAPGKSSPQNCLQSPAAAANLQAQRQQRLRKQVTGDVDHAV